jgi:hypothetical protein
VSKEKDMKAAFLSSSLISSKGMAEPASRSQPPKELIAHRKLTPEQTASVKPEITLERKTGSVLNRVSASAHPPSEQPAASIQAPVLNLQVPQEEQVRKPIRRKPVASSAQQYKQEQKKLKKDKLGRVRMSIRLDPDDHLALKLLAAHARKSSQNILEEALREYTTNHGHSILPQNCDCLQKPF